MCYTFADLPGLLRARRFMRNELKTSPFAVVKLGAALLHGDNPVHISYEDEF